MIRERIRNKDIEGDELLVRKLRQVLVSNKSGDSGIRILYDLEPLVEESKGRLVRGTWRQMSLAGAET